jgi:hypothetical protein
MYNLDNDESELSNLASTNETVQNESKKKKKRRKNKKKKKKAKEEDAKPAQQVNDEESIIDDPEFEEDLKQFQMRLMQCNNPCGTNGPQGSTPYRKLKPNVSNDWLLTIREKSKSLSESFPRSPQMTLVS